MRSRSLPPVLVVFACACALEPLRIVYHYDVPGVRLGPAIPAASPDHPLHGHGPQRPGYNFLSSGTSPVGKSFLLSCRHPHPDLSNR